VLHAVDDLLVEQGYAAMTMKGIAARAGVGRQTVYRWWSSKAEILLEAVRQDAATELVVEPASTTRDELDSFRALVVTFLTDSPAGAAYRALVGEAQHDRHVADLIRGSDVILAAASPLLRRAQARGDVADGIDLTTAALEIVGPIVFGELIGAASLPPVELSSPPPRTPRR
jgi:AcrR family transcriptional regulator